MMVTHPSVLLIEDSPSKCGLFRLALAQTRRAEVQYGYKIAEVTLAYSSGRRIELEIDSMVH
jgi:hypothetical protein